MEWYISAEHGWSVAVGSLGKGLGNQLPTDVWEDLKRTYVGPEPGENWVALHLTVALFRRIAVEVGGHLGYSYPDDLHRRVIDFVEGIRKAANAGKLSLHEKDS